MPQDPLIEGWCRAFPLRRLALWEFSEVGEVEFVSRARVMNKDLAVKRFPCLDMAKDKLMAELDRQVRATMLEDSPTQTALLVHLTPVVEVVQEPKSILFVAHMRGWVVPRELGLLCGWSINKEFSAGHPSWRHDAKQSNCIIKSAAKIHNP